jgi:hypothetical protein
MEGVFRQEQIGQILNRWLGPDYGLKLTMVKTPKGSTWAYVPVDEPTAPAIVAERINHLPFQAESAPPVEPTHIGLDFSIAQVVEEFGAAARWLGRLWERRREKRADLTAA